MYSTFKMHNSVNILRISVWKRNFWSFRSKFYRTVVLSLQKLQIKQCCCVFPYTRSENRHVLSASIIPTVNNDKQCGLIGQHPHFDDAVLFVRTWRYSYVRFIAMFVLQLCSFYSYVCFIAMLVLQLFSSSIFRQYPRSPTYYANQFTNQYTNH